MTEVAAKPTDGGPPRRYLPSKVTPIGAVKLSLSDVSRIYERLEALVQEQADRELSELVKAPQQTQEEFEAYKSAARSSAFKITVTLGSPNSQSLYGEDSEVLRSPRRPDKIGLVYLTNVTAYQGFSGRRPTNAFELWLDFSKPPLMDARSIVSAPTANASRLSVQGDRESWMAGVADAVLGVTNTRKVTDWIVHRSFAYDAGLFVFAIPFGFYLCWRFSSIVDASFSKIHPFLSAAAYLYIISASVWLYRVFFGYAKWAFPRVELVENGDAAPRHRAFFGLIVIGLLIDVIWECRRLF